MVSARAAKKNAVTTIPGVKKTAAQLLAEVDAVFGKGVVTMGNHPDLTVSYLPTECPPIDYLLHGGLPLGRFTEIYGDYSSLKSYIGYKTIASAQKRGLLAALIDTEHAYNEDWAKAIGIDTEQLIYRQPQNGEEAIDLAEVLMRGGVDLIVFDSVHAAIPQAEQNKRLHTENVQPARLAALMSIAMRKLTAANKKTAVLWINQTRLNVGITYGNPESVPGGRALPYYASYRLGLKKSGRMFQEIKVMSMKPDGKREKKTVKLAIGQKINATVEKSKLSSPFRDIDFIFSFNRGEIDNWNFLANLALDADVIGYGAGYWWEVGSKAKQREVQFRGDHPEEWLVEKLLGKVPNLEAVAEYLGVPQLAKKKASVQKRSSSKAGARKSTPAPVRAKSKTTAQTKSASTKSKTLLARIS